MNHKLLVANRSEIACRVFQACRELGIATAALQAPGDEEARHLTYADEILEVDSYLNVEAIVAAAKEAGVTMIHPGYGFLSERPVFVRAVEAAGIAFLGPVAETMERMGGKTAAKELAESNDVPTLPWAKLASAGAKELEAAADQIGFPLLLKAVAGGGGKGMRRVDSAAELIEAAESAQAEAQSAFGDSTLFLEKLVERPRHIEVQVFGFGDGNGVVLGDRECSLQRRHQKVWEEAPAPRLTDQTRQGLAQAALNLVKATNYRSAGTVEFLVDDDQGFYFLEMNTRLQVEHPVTELVFGVDLVKKQIELAMHGRVELEVKEPRGHAIEVRLYAEDPAQGFLPTPGRITDLSWPTGVGIRVDSGIESGQEIGTSFDSMLAKLIAFGEDRDHAIARLRFALEETVILGTGTNQTYLYEIAKHPKVIEGDVFTRFLETDFAYETPELVEEELDLIAAARAAGLDRSSGRSAGLNTESELEASPWQDVTGWKVGGAS